MSTPKGVRSVNENIVQPGRAFIITDLTDVSWDQIPDGSLYINPVNGIQQVKLAGETNWVPAGLKNDGTLVIGRDTALGVEVFTITSPDNGDGTFTYKNAADEQRYKEKDSNGFVFELEPGESYIPGRNHLFVVVNGTKECSSKTGEIEEIDHTRFRYKDTLTDGDKLTIKWIKWVRIGNPYPRFFEGYDDPNGAEVGDFFLDFDGTIGNQDPADDDLYSRTVSWVNVLGKPTTIQGYGIIDDISYVGHRHTAGEISGLDTTLAAIQQKNTEQDTALAEQRQLFNSIFTVGMIIDWYGAANAVPAGWHICDGTNGTPDLRDKFIVGAGSAYALNAAGGEATHTLTTAEMPSHDHPHTHKHKHDRGDMNITGTFNPVWEMNTTPIATGAFGYTKGVGNSNECGDDGSAKLTWDFDASRPGAWTGHTSEDNTAASSHAAGGGQAHNNLPPYYALYKIMYIGQ